MKYLSMKYSWLQTSVVLLMTFVVGLAAISTAAIAAPQVPSPKTSPAKAKSSKTVPANAGSAANKLREATASDQKVKAETDSIIKAPPALISSPLKDDCSQTVQIMSGTQDDITSSDFGKAGGTGNRISPGSLGLGVGISGKDVSKPLSVMTNSRGNIALYRKEIYDKVSQGWHPKRAVESVVVLLVIAHDGSLLEREIVVGSGSKRSDKEILKAIDETQFPPLPEWFKGKRLNFKLELSKTLDK
jgi:hypothetical protein